MCVCGTAPCLPSYFVAGVETPLMDIDGRLRRHILLCARASSSNSSLISAPSRSFSGARGVWCQRCSYQQGTSCASRNASVQAHSSGRRACALTRHSVPMLNRSPMLIVARSRMCCTIRHRCATRSQIAQRRSRHTMCLTSGCCTRLCVTTDLCSMSYVVASRSTFPSY